MIDKRHIPFSPPDISDLEISEVSSVLKSGWLTTGSRTKLFERRLAAFIKTGDTCIDCNNLDNKEEFSNRVVCLNSATAAEELNLRMLGIGEGDEVLLPAYTYTATASAAIHCGAKVVFIDIQKDGASDSHMPEMDYKQLESAITPKTKAIIAVDLAGIVCDYEQIYDIAQRKKNIFKPIEDNGTVLGNLSSRIQNSIGHVPVVADCAHALGASRVFNGKQRYCGDIAQFSSFSFHAVKNLTTGEGGAVTWLPIKGIDDAEIYNMYQLLSLHGQSKNALAKTKAGEWEYDIIGPWYKCNMTDIMAAIGLKQLDRYKELLKRREKIVARYDSVCDDLGFMHLHHHTDLMDSSKHLYLIRIPGIDESKRNNTIEYMADMGVSTNVHYKPLPMMTAYGNSFEKCPNSYDYYKNLISLPLHTKLSDQDIDYICSVLRSVSNRLKLG